MNPDRHPGLIDHASRREFLRATGSAALLAALARYTPAWAQTSHSGHGAQERAPAPGSVPAASGAAKIVELAVERIELPLGDRVGHVVSVNRSLPAPLLRFREGDEVELRVANRLDESTSIHWHGLLVPAPMDGVPGVSFDGIEAGSTFVYRFPLKQYGTYWYHAHTAMHEQLGLYGPIVIDPAAGEPFSYDREHVIVFSDWTFTHPHVLFAKLKKRSNFSNMQRRTAVDFAKDVAQKGFAAAWSDWSAWAQMRMDPTDIADLTGANFIYLLNGQPAETAWTGRLQPGERVRLRFINAAATTHFDVRIPGLDMTVVQADGQHVRPLRVHELRMGAAETYDVIIEPTENRAYTIFAETTDRSGYALGTLAPAEGMRGPIPERRKRPVRTMADMGMGEHDMSGSAPGQQQADAGGMTHGQHTMPESGAPTPEGEGGHAGHTETNTAAADPSAHGAHSGGNASAGTRNTHAEHGASQPTDHGGNVGHSTATSGSSTTPGDHSKMEMPENIFGPGNAMMAMNPASRAHEPGLGLGEDGWSVLVYRDLIALDPRPVPEPQREIVMHATGNMERFIWGFDGKKFSEAEPVRLRFGERVRITFINETMMEHPLHLHGMFMELENGSKGLLPLKHTVIVKPAEKISVLVTADAPGHWAFHCHLQYHMEAGMFRVFEVA